MKYKEGDRILIKSLDWYNANKDEYGYIDCGSREFFTKMSDLCGKIATIKEICKTNCYRLEEYDFDWTDEMIECKVEKETKFGTASNPIEPKSNANCLTLERVDETKPEPKFKVGDILFYRGETSGYLKVEEIRVENGEIRYYETSRNVYLVENDPDVFADKVCSVETEETKSEDELLDDYEELTDRAFKGGYEKCKSDIELNGFQLPEGYQFVDENGNVINATKIVLEKKKKEYPKTYCECKDILGLWDIDDTERGYYKTDLIDKLQMLLICRDAYWKIAGEEMGLGKPWEPDWDAKDNHFYTIHTFNGKVECSATAHRNAVLIFPTKEMRDAFKENFDPDIEICKELL